MIEARNLTKVFRVAAKSPGLKGAIKHLVRPRYEVKPAVLGINLHIDEGDSVAYVGPNGAGKSTTVKMLAGVLVPTDGEIRVFGKDPYLNRMENSRDIGVVFGQRTQLWWDLPVQESFRLLADIYDVSSRDFRKNMDELIDLLELGPLLNKAVRHISLGQRMRCEIAAALLHSPRILYLDEPTVGLDVSVKNRLRQFIRQRNLEKGVTVMLTSHDLNDVKDICRRIVMIDRGRIVFDGPLTKIQEAFGGERSVHIDLSEFVEDAVSRAAALLKHLGDVEVTQSEPNRLSIRFDASVISTSAVVGQLLSEFPVKDLKIEETDIESIIRRLYDGELSVDEVR